MDPLAFLLGKIVRVSEWILEVKHTCDHVADSHGWWCRAIVAAVGCPIQDAGVKRHYRGCQGRNIEYIMFVSKNQMKTPACLTADICSRYGVPRLSIDAKGLCLMHAN